MFRAPNPDNSPETAFVTTTEMALNLGTALVENNRHFTSELLRLALAGIAVIGVIYDKIITHLPGISEWGAAWSVLFFGLAVAAALSHRFLNNVSLRRYIWRLRFHEASKVRQGADATSMTANSQECLTGRNNLLIGAAVSKFLSASFLAIGAFVLALAFMHGLWTARPGSTQQTSTAPTFPSHIDVHVHGLQPSSPANANPPR
jgi:hypothetical protein